MKTKWLLYLFICSMQIVSYSQVNVRDTIDDETRITYLTNFENDYSFIHIDSATVHLWEVGKPHKWFCESAFSGENVLATGLTNGLPPHSETSITFKFERCLYCWYSNCIYLTGFLFLSKYEFNDSSGVIFEISYDKGVTWENIFVDTLFDCDTNQFGYPAGTSFNPTLLPNGELGLTGTKTNWLPADAIFKSYPETYNGAGAITSIYFRWKVVNFSSQEVGGIMIDDIEFQNCTWCEFLKINEFNNTDEKIRIYPNPAQQNITIDFSNISEIPKSITIFNLNGEICYYNKNISCPVFEIGNLHLLDGQYYVVSDFGKNNKRVNKITIKN